MRRIRTVVFTTIGVVLGPATVWAQTITSDIVANTTWSGTVVVADSVMVDTGVVLTISAGTRVAFNPGCRLKVQGAVHALGTEQDSVVLTASDTSAGWLGMHFDRTPIQADTTLLRFCRIEYANVPGAHVEGGAVDAYRTGPLTFERCCFRRNRAHRAAAIAADLMNLTLRSCTFEHNVSVEYGPAVMGYGRLRMTDCVIRENTGTFVVRWSSMSGEVSLIGGCSFIGNVGGVIMAHAHGVDGFWISGCLFRGNTSSPTAAIDYDGNSSHDNLQVVNCTFVENRGQTANAIRCVDGVVTLVNSIVWNGEGVELGGHQYNAYALRNCCVTGGYAGMNVLDTSPLFADSAAGDFSLTGQSPCVDAGTHMTDLLVLPETDLAGNPRITGDRIDIGAYEWEPPTATHKPFGVALRTADMDGVGRVVHTLLGRSMGRAQASGYYVIRNGLVWHGSIGPRLAD